MKITALPLLAARNGSELLPVTSDASGSPETYALSLADLVNSAALIAYSSTDGTLAANSDELLPTQKATKTYVTSAIAAAIAALVGAAPAQLDAINELAAALGNDENFAATMTAALAGKVSAAQLAAATAGLAPAALTVEASAETAYTLQLTDAGKHKRMTAATAIALTVPTNAAAAFAIGTRIRFTAAGLGLVTIAGAGVTLNSRGGALKSAGQFAVFELEKVGVDAWDVLGDLVV